MSANRSDTRTIDPLLTIGQIAGVCQVSTKTVWRWIKRGELVAHLLGRQWRVAPNDFDTFLKLRRRG